MALFTCQNEPPGKRVARHENVANVVVDLHAEGAIFRPWSQLDSRFQRGRDAATGVELARVPFSTPAFLDEGCLTRRPMEVWKLD